jgi:hypothetical protein
MVAANFQRLRATIHVSGITRIKGRHRNKTRMRGAFALVRDWPQGKWRAMCVYRRPLSFSKMHSDGERESTEAQTFFLSVPQCDANTHSTESQTLKSNQWHECTLNF